MTSSATLDGVQILVNPVRTNQAVRLDGESGARGDALVGAVNCDVDDRVLINIPKSQVGRDNQLLGLEA